MRNASVSWTRSSTNDRGIHQSRLRHEHSGFRSLLEGTSIPVHAGRGGRPRDAGLVGPHLDRIAEKLAGKFGVSKSEVDPIVERWATCAEVAPIERKAGWVLQDPDDDKFIETALVGGAAIIVSGDHHLLALGKVQGIEILTALQFLDRLAVADLEL